MFKKDERPMPAVSGGESSVGTLIGKGTHINGTIKVNGSLRVDGEVEGHVIVSSGLVVGPSGVLTAEIHVQDAVVAGRIQGKIISKGRVELHKGSRIEGDVHAAVFKIEDGAFFQGNCTMGETPPHGEKKELPMPQRTGTQAGKGSS
ncbi:MAG: polymer-forming cytoskeletal protein [Candidatus Eisenbacteria bacterium]|uniref:Polymer-forming cytoskeletal protein n=1 Tax=Eiseniibacteriota bacterium TaxID=2212470 RepID=A0A948W5M1_UNCEI|nr:polymer-forming cytoskeletal protein [Candidatus Eisenbacteria bacterium]MBU1948242.1 polymer-forming cytoskeletal protein [Candidatus Eisenbacteria bacterium]MBU2690564.1 polymer-forming cytoskeletal protein [Candidatus Eisenbacteria bacterium]